MNYFNGRSVCDLPFDKTKTQCVIAKTGGIDNDWENLKLNNPNLWNDDSLKQPENNLPFYLANRMNTTQKVLKKQTKNLPIKHTITQS